MLQNTKIAVFTISGLLRENQKMEGGGGRGGGGKITSLPQTRLWSRNTSYQFLKTIDKRPVPFLR